MLRAYRRKLLVISADILRAEVANFRIHDLLGRLKPVGKRHHIPFRLKPREKIRPESFQVLEVPWVEMRNIGGRQRAGRAHQHIIKEMIDFAGNISPSGMNDLPRLSVSLRIGVGFAYPIVVAPLPCVVRVSHRVIRPERHVDA